MGKFKFTELDIEGMFIVEPTVFEDNRGYFMESYNENDFKEAGYDLTFVQDNQSKSSKGVLRGLHLQVNYPQGKLVRVIKGEVFDVGVDLRADSPTYENGQESFSLKTTRGNSSFLLSLRTVLWSCQTRRNSSTNAQNSTTAKMKAE
jgi:dTDP-4-dehydrorhamnose 3,5-epimerase